MFPVIPIWSVGHPPHTATELCSSLPPSPRSSSDLQLWPPLELIFSRYYSVVPFVLNLEDSIQDPFGLHRREFSAMCAPTVPIFFRLISSSTETWTVLLHRSRLLIVSGHLTWRILRRQWFIKVCSCVVIFLGTNHDSLAYNKTDLIFELKILILELSFCFLEFHMGRRLLKADPALFLRFIIS
jgi:hypothetical protein